MSDVQIAVIDQQDTQIVLAVPGVQGATGSEIPTGGTADQVLRKNSSTDYDTNWSQVTSAMIADGTIVNADVNNAAAIAGTKISPDFGGQAVTTTGQISGARVNVTGNTAPSNGLYSPGANQVALSTNGTGRLFVDANGNVGVGVTPAALLDLNFATNTRLQISASSSDVILVSTTTAAAAAQNLRLVASNTLFYNNNAEAVRITSAGLVGIGTSSPGALLDVNNVGRFLSASPSYPSAGKGVEIYFDSAGDLGYLQAYDRSGSAWKGLALAGDTVRFRTAGNEVGRFDASGRLLVGTSSDSGGALLQVNGNRVRIATAKTPASASDTGTAGEVCWDTNYIYVCTATNTWKRAALSTW